jgi:uncharacterized protein YbjT (DUF2867 family)
MRIVIAGGHGQIALRLERRIAQRGDSGVALIRNPEHEADVREAGAEPVVVDLESTTPDALAEHLAGADAVVFAAGAGPGSTADRKVTVDRDAALLLADAATRAGVTRYLLVSAMNIDPPPTEAEDDSVWGHYLRAKKEAEDELRARPLDLTILRPGRLTDDEGTRRVRLAAPSAAIGHGEVPRDDVAAVLLALLDEPATGGTVLELIGGDTPVPDAVEDVVGGDPGAAPR